MSELDYRCTVTETHAPHHWASGIAGGCGPGAVTTLSLFCGGRLARPEEG